LSFFYWTLYYFSFFYWPLYCLSFFYWPLLVLRQFMRYYYCNVSGEFAWQ
jgi:hypothetical protein